MRRHSVVLLFLVMALLGAACGGGGKGDKPAAVPASGGKDPTMAAKAKAATLQPTDFPPGFLAQPEEPGQGLGLETVWGDLTGCLGVGGTAQRTGVATSPTFLRGLATQGRSTVEYTTEDAASSIATALGGPKFQGCATEAFTADVKRSAPQGGKPGPAALAPRDAPLTAAKTFAYRVTATISLDELKVPLFQDFLVVFKGGAVIRMLFLNPGSEFPQDLERSLVDAVVSRA